MFDFDNTPINEYTKLKANYTCAAEPVLSYNGDWARITLLDGTMLEVANQSQLDTLLSSNSTATVAGVSVNVNNIQKIEFGKKVTSASGINLQYWHNLTAFNGFHKGLTTIPSSLLYGSGTDPEPHVGGVVVLPSTITNVTGASTFMMGNFVGVIISNCDVTKLASNTTYMFATKLPTSAAYTQGIKVMGKTAHSFIAKYPNLNNSSGYYRNLYNGNTIDAFVEALEDGSAEDIMPPGTEIPDLIGGVENPLVVGKYGVVSTTNGDTPVVGLTRKYLSEPIAFDSGGSNIYTDSSLRTYLNSTYITLLDSRIKDKLIPFNHKYYNDTSLINLNDKVTIFSAEEVGLLYSTTTGEGEMWELWKQRTGQSEPLASPSTTQSNGRIMYKASSTSTKGDWWILTRYLYQSNKTNSLYIATNGTASNYAANNSTGISVLPYFYLPAKIGVTVSFNANGGTPEPPDQRVFIGSYADKPSPDPSKEGAEFVGWFLPGQTYDFVGEIPVMFRMNGGSPQEPTQYVKAGEYATAPAAAPEREGFEFIGWYEAGTVPDDWDGVNVV